MEVVLHLGLHRTGTSALQSALRRARARLAEAGAEAPDTALLRRRVVAALDFAERGGPLRGARRALARGRIRDLAAAAGRRGARRLILSDEAMIGHLDTIFAADGPYPNAAWRLELIAEALAPWPTRAVAALRDPADWIASAYGYALARRPLPGFDALRPTLLGAPDRLADALSAANAVFPGLMLWRSDLMRDRPRPVMRALAGDAAPALRAQRKEHNSGLSGPAVVEAQRLRALREPFDDDTRAALAARWPMAAHGPFDPWSAQERATLAAGMARLLARLESEGARSIPATRPGGPQDEDAAPPARLKRNAAPMARGGGRS